MCAKEGGVGNKYGGPNLVKIGFDKLAYERQRRDKIQVLLFNYLLQHPCVDCGESNPIVLEFDHIRGPKEFAITRAASIQASQKRILAEIEKCVVRCANCHRVQTARQQNWKRFQLTEERNGG